MGQQRITNHYRKETPASERAQLGLAHAQARGLAANDSLSFKRLRAAHTPQQES